MIRREVRERMPGLDLVPTEPTVSGTWKESPAVARNSSQTTKSSRSVRQRESETMEAITVAPAKYAKGMMAVTPHDQIQGMKGRSSRLAEYLKGRWSNREHAYIMSVNKVVRLRMLLDEGWDATPILNQLYKDNDLTTLFKKPE